MTRHLELRILSGRFAIAQLAPDAPVPSWVGGEITCIARTPTELSIVCAEEQVPASIRANGPWRCFEVAGPLDFSEVGILSSLTAVLRDAGISVFALSTFDTDYLLVREDLCKKAAAAFEGEGHSVQRREA